MATLNEIEKLTKEYADARRVLEDRVRDLNYEMTVVKRSRLPGIKKAVEGAAERQARLQASIEESPALFRRPRTVVFHGIKVGYQKGKGELRWDAPEQVVKLIKKHFPEMEETLVKVTEAPVKSALAQLSAADLKKLGVTVVETGDQVLIKCTDSDVDKLVNALLKEDEVREVA